VAHVGTQKSLIIPTRAISTAWKIRLISVAWQDLAA